MLTIIGVVLSKASATAVNITQQVESIKLFRSVHLSLVTE